MLTANEIIALFCIKVGWPTPMTPEAPEIACSTLQDLDLIDDKGVTERGRVFIDHVEKLPMPQSTWTMK